MTEKNMTTAERLEQCRQVLMVRHFEENGEKLIRVPLFGKRGRGKFMVLDAAVWREGRDAKGWPADWILDRESTSGRDYVGTSQRPVSNGYKILFLARLIKDAKKGETVIFLDGDTLNLRSSNLKKMSLAEFRARGFGRAKAQPFVEVEDDTPLAGTAEEVPW